MKWVVIVVRTVVGLGFIITGLDGFFRFLSLPPPPSAEAQQFMGLLVGSGYMLVVKACELVGGLLLVTGRLVPLGIVILMPVAVNILLYETFLMREPGPGYVLVPLLVFLIWGYRFYFLPLFTLNPKIGG
jgi:uncharacterized membrane protein YphA (DoxX/SURF4 family)